MFLLHKLAGKWKAKSNLTRKKLQTENSEVLKAITAVESKKQRLQIDFEVVKLVLQKETSP